MMKNCMFHIQHFLDNLLFELYGLIDTFLNHNKSNNDIFLSSVLSHFKMFGLK